MKWHHEQQHFISVDLADKVQDLFIIEYPAIIKDIEKAFKTLHWAQIRHCLDGDKDNENIIELRPRLEDVFSHPINGRMIPSNNTILLKLKVEKTAKAVAHGEAHESRKVVHACFLGTVHKIVRFRESADFQWHVHPDSYLLSLHKALLDFDVNSLKTLSTGLGEPLEGDPLFPPPVFIHSGVPVIYHMEPFSASNFKKTRLPLTAHHHKRTRFNAFYYKKIMDHDIPVHASEDALKTIEAYPEETKEKMKQLFHTRPIWSSMAISNQFESNERKYLKKLLISQAYFYSNGPWRNCWVKYDYSPKTDPGSRFFQVLELRSFFNGQAQTFSYSYKEYNTNKRSHILDEHMDPNTICHLFQYCDILDGDLKTLIDDPAYQSRSFSIHHGWWSLELKTKIVALIKLKYQNALKMIQMKKSGYEYRIRPAKVWHRKGTPKLNEASSSSSGLKQRRRMIANVEAEPLSVRDTLGIDEGNNSFEEASQDEIEEEEFLESMAEEEDDQIEEYEIFEEEEGSF